MVFKCIVSGCNNITTKGLHSFPANKTVAEKWIMAIKAYHLLDLLKENKLARSYRKVCKKHFNEEDYVNGTNQLVQNSVPSLFLPDEDVVCNFH